MKFIKLKHDYLYCDKEQIKRAKKRFLEYDPFGLKQGMILQLLNIADHVTVQTGG